MYAVLKLASIVILVYYALFSLSALKMYFVLNLLRKIFQAAAMLLFYITQKIYHNSVCIFLKVYYHTLFQNPELGGAGILPTS